MTPSELDMQTKWSVLSFDNISIVTSSQLSSSKKSLDIKMLKMHAVLVPMSLASSEVSFIQSDIYIYFF